ncbi:MAG TPA: pyridoxamine 5'-phosphate oxidase family protein [Hyphomicrobium sp.]|nr:pyridoxamine 5'-phosphate oxidase family protein [Hyphomicrobium sp.]
MSSASDIAFTPSVKSVQERRGSRKGYAQMEAKGGWETTVSPDLAAFIAEVRSFYLATASKDGQPYIQHRGGPKGFLNVLDAKTLAFADFSGNRQYLTTGNLAENPRAFIFLMDYASRRRVKLWGEARVVEDDPELTRRLTIEGYLGRPEQVIVFTLKAWDVNCPQHIPQMFFVEDIKEAVDGLKNRIAQLEQENAELRAAQGAKEQRGGT